MTTALAYKKRLAALEDRIKKKGLDSLLVTNEANVTYLTGFCGNDSALLLTSKKKFFLTDSRFVEEASGTVKGFEIVLIRRSTYEALRDLVKDLGIRKMGFEAMNLPYEVGARLGDLLKPVKLVPTKDLVEDGRVIKDGPETALIRKAIRLTRDVFDRAVRLARPGATEEAVSRAIEAAFIERGARAAFDPIVASGANSSKPHARPGRTRIGKNSFVMLDIGCRLNSYCADLTRMLVLGRCADRFRTIYRVVEHAQELAIAEITPGAKIADVDRAARRYIDDNGFGKYFGHALGHGVGMEVHEKPSISGLSTEVLKAGMVFTVEPAVYVPGFGGVRIEDMVLVTDTGHEILTR